LPAAGCYTATADIAPAAAWIMQMAAFRGRSFFVSGAKGNSGALTAAAIPGAIAQGGVTAHQP
jgi:hypothetical protein